MGMQLTCIRIQDLPIHTSQCGYENMGFPSLNHTPLLHKYSTSLKKDVLVKS